MIPLLAAALAGLASLRVDDIGVLPALWLLAGISVPLAATDLRTRRLPNALVLPAYPALLLALGAGAVLAHTGPKDAGLAAGRALLGAIALAAAFGALHALRPGGLGAGDVKLAGVLGLALGALSWDAVLTGATSGLILGAAAGLATWVRRGRQAAFAFGPGLLVGAWAAILA